MSYEDVIRVAQAKIDPTRRARIAAEMGAKPGEPLDITEFLKPGIDEFCSMLPPRLARRLLALAERRGWTRSMRGMQVNSQHRSRVSCGSGCSPSCAAGGRRTYRFEEEQRAIDAWLALDRRGRRTSRRDLALEIAECARLIKGYGDTHKRGAANYRLIETQVIRPALAGHIPLQLAIDAIASARTAALVDPDGESLAKCLAQIDTQSSRRIAAE